MISQRKQGGKKNKSVASEVVKVIKDERGREEKRKKEDESGKKARTLNRHP